MIAKKSYSIPFIIWIIAGTIIPLASIAFYGFTNREGNFTFDNVTAMFRNPCLPYLLSLRIIAIGNASRRHMTVLMKASKSERPSA